jgi:hypothetical protein
VPANCFVTQAAEPQNITLFNGSEIISNTIGEQLIVTRLLDHSFHTRHYFTVYQSSHTPEAFDYWRKVNIVANQVGSIFDSPPAEVKSNLFNTGDPSELVSGYFQAVNQSYQRFYLVPNQLPHLLTAYCEYSPARPIESYTSECLDCITARNSSYVRPEWF